MFYHKHLYLIHLILFCPAVTLWLWLFSWLTNTAVVVAGQLVTCIAFTVVRALGVHTSVHAVVGQGTLVSVCRKTHTQDSHEDMGKSSNQLVEDSFSHVINWEHVLRRTYPHSGLRFSGSLEDTGRCKSLWCCSTSVQAHMCVYLSHIHQYLQETHKHTHRHWKDATQS